MAQRLRDDKIGPLSHSGGIITLQSSLLTVGGQQYSTSALQHTLPALTANTLYFLYVVLSGGNPILIQSTNVNSVGPVGQVAWKLVGAFYSNGLSSVAFGSFVTIEGLPKSTNSIDLLISHTWGAAATTTAKFEVNGNYVRIIIKVVGVTTLSSTNLTLTLPSTLTMDTAAMLSPGTYLATLGSAACTGTHHLIPLRETATTLIFGYPTNTNDLLGILNSVAPTTLNSSYQLISDIEYPVVGWTNTPLKDL